MKNKSRFLTSVLCLLMVVFCAYTLVACSGDDKCSHKWSEWSVKANATCTNEGTKERKCSECGEIETNSINALGHAWQDATCTEPKTCTVCNTTEGSTIAHTPNADDGDCTTAITCSVCGDITTPAKANHTGGTATCEHKAACSVCGKEYGSLAAHTPNADDGDCTTAITCSVCGDVTTPAKASHTGGTATCQSKAICTVCNTVYGDYGVHNYDQSTWGYKTAEGHAHMCSVNGCNAHDTIVDHTSSGAATETTAEKCTACGYVINPALGHKTHTPASDWSSNPTHHWHECVGCEDQEFNKAEHTYDNACDTTCNVCGYTRTVVHSYTVLKKDANNHWYECSICHDTKPNSAEAHKGGAATCQHKAECSVCGNEYGNLGSHSPNADDGNCTTAITCSVCGEVTTVAKTHAFYNACDTSCNNVNCNYTRTTTHTPNADDGDCTTAITCSVCGTVTTPAKANHTGGTATCQHKAECSVCGKEYGNLGAHTPNADDGDCTTAITCSVCSEVTTPAKAGHTGGTATCQHKAECSVCGKEYGDLGAHTPNADDGDCTTAITCSICGEVTTPAKANHTGGTATCQHKAECSVCGKEYGNLATHTPNTDDGDCTTAITCSVCGDVTTPAKASHTGGTATCKDKAKCTVCGKAYGNLKAHTPNADDGDCTTAITCSICGEVTTPAKASHTGGTATCQHKAECSVCGKEYGDLGAHTPNADDGDCMTAITCSICGEVTTPAKASHAGGTATCQAKAICSECSKEYGEIDPDNHANISVTGTFSECEGGTKNLRCRSCKESWAETLTAKGHNYVGGVCTTCGVNKPTNDFTTEYTVNGDDTVTVTVKLSGVVKVAGFNITINYDPSVLYLESTQQGAFSVTENKGTSGQVVLVHTNSTSTTTNGVVLTLTFAIDSFENTNIKLTVNEIKETWYDNSIHDTSSSATGVTVSLAQ